MRRTVASSIPVDVAEVLVAGVFVVELLVEG